MVNSRPANIYIFYCSSGLDTEEPPWVQGELSEELKAVPLPCSGKIDIPYLAKAFETGADGVAVVICPQGKCRFLEGDLRARKRAEAIDGLLEEVGLGKGRVTVMQMEDGGTEQLIREIDDFRAKIKSLIKTQ